MCTLSLKVTSHARFDKYRKTYFKTKKRRISLQFFSGRRETGKPGEAEITDWWHPDRKFPKLQQVWITRTGPPNPSTKHNSMTEQEGKTSFKVQERYFFKNPYSTLTFQRDPCYRQSKKNHHHQKYREGKWYIPERQA